MHVKSKKELRQYLKDNPGLQRLTLDLGDCPRLTRLPTLPTTLSYLQVFNGLGLTRLPALPTTLIYLRVDNCPGLASLPTLPTELKTLVLDKTTALGLRAYQLYRAH
ncbi:MAG: hypothetical protein WCT03_03785 [Candidatus Obscuribacterales bacterium]|jgi:hypothetical protein